MNKPIINGIDVSECSYYNKDNEPYCCEVWDNECEAQNCYFKQFKRLQKENEELKERLCETKQFLKNEREENSKFCQQIEAYQLSDNEAQEIIAELKASDLWKFY